MRALPVTPHSWCGSWNYTINPATQNTDQQASAVAQNTTLARSQTLKLLSNPVLTGMTRQELDELVAQLAPARAAQTAQRCYARRGGRRRNAPGAGLRPLLTDTDRVVLTLVYQRQHCSQKVLAELLESTHTPSARQSRTPAIYSTNTDTPPRPPPRVHHRGRPVAVFDNRRGAHRATTPARPVV